MRKYRRNGVFISEKGDILVLFQLTAFCICIFILVQHKEKLSTDISLCVITMFTDY